jgi:hypothetical protein
MGLLVAALSLAWFLFQALPAGRGFSRRRGLAQLAAMGLTALLLSAVLLLPLAEALPYLNRSRLSLDEAGLFALSWPQLLTTLIPTLGGEPEQLVYAGFPLAVLAAAGLRRKRDGTTWFLVGTIVLAVLLSLGRQGLLYPLLFRLVPGLSWLRVPTRAWILAAFGLALLAGRGLDTLVHLRPSGPARRPWLPLALGSLLLSLALATSLALASGPSQTVPPAAVLVGLWGLVMAALLLLAPRLQPRLLVTAVLLIVALDFGLIRTAWTEMRTPAEAFAWGAEAAGYLAEHPGRFRVYSPSYSLPQHTALQHGLALADGVDPFQLASYADFLARAGGYEVQGYSVSLPPRLDDTSAQLDAGRLGLLNVGYVASEFPITAEGLRLEEQFDGTYLYRNEQLLPRAFVVPEGGITETADGGIDLKRPIEAIPARVSAYTPNRIAIEVDGTEPGFLVLSEVWYPGWLARIDGRPAPIRRVEGSLRGLELEPGRHQIEFRFSPGPALAGLALSALSTLALLLGAAYRLVSRDRARRQP